MTLSRFIRQRLRWERRRQRRASPAYPLSVSMTPAFYDSEHMLLRAQLACLSAQTCKDFDVWLIDPHYQKRKSVVPELAALYHLDIKHVPYTPNTRIAKYYDCAIFNAAFCYSDSPRNVRYSCYRFVRPTWIERILATPEHINIDFYMHAVGPDIIERHLREEDRVNRYKLIWDFKSTDIAWELLPPHSVYTDDTCTALISDADTLGNWIPFMDRDAPAARVPLNLYGNICWNRDQWLALNGVNEVITNAAHWEDLDFDCRAGNANQQVVRYAHLLYRLQHSYGSFSQRSNVEVDVPLTKICDPCTAMITRNGGDAGFGEIIRQRLKAATLRHYYQHRAWVCTTCQLSGPIYDGIGLDHYIFHLQDMGIKRAPVLRTERIGRNLNILTEQLSRCPTLASKVTVYNNSWHDPYYYEN